MTRKEKAVQLFKEGYNCAQSVFGAYADLYEIPADMAFRISASFGAGVGRMREVCGCVSGMSLVAGLETGATEGADRDAKARNYAVVQEMAKKFREQSGGSLLGLKKPEGSAVPAERTADYYKKRPCVELIEAACDIIEETFDLGGRPLA
mgnify:CR=1 FL=1